MKRVGGGVRWIRQSSVRGTCSLSWVYWWLDRHREMMNAATTFCQSWETTLGHYGCWCIRCFVTGRSDRFQDPAGGRGAKLRIDCRYRC